MQQIFLLVGSLYCRVLFVLWLQFNSSDELRLKLINTGSDTLVYAADEAPLGINYRSQYFGSIGWHDGENWLGTTLMSVREKLVCIC